MLNPSRTLSVLCLSAALCALAPAGFAETAPATISVSGEGVSEVAPDMATLSIGVTTVGGTAAEALAANSVALAAVLENLRAAGVADRDLQTSNLSVNPNWSGYSSSSGDQQITGYTATNVVTVRIRQMATLGEVLDAAVKDGANTLYGLTFGLQEPRPAMDAARKAAVEDARAKAELYAAAAGVELGRIVSISEGGAMGGPAPMYRDAKLEAAPVPVEAGELSMAASVTVVWELAD